MTWVYGRLPLIHAKPNRYSNQWWRIVNLETNCDGTLLEMHQRKCISKCSLQNVGPFVCPQYVLLIHIPLVPQYVSLKCVIIGLDNSLSPVLREAITDFTPLNHTPRKNFIEKMSKATNRPVSQMRATLGGLSRTSGKLWQDYLNCYMFWT